MHQPNKVELEKRWKVTMKHTYISKTNTTKSIIKLKPKSKVIILEFEGFLCNINLVNALYGWRSFLHEMPFNTLWHTTHQNYSKLVKERKLIEKWKSGGILSCMKEVSYVKFLQFGNRFNINHTIKGFEFTKKGNEYWLAYYEKWKNVQWIST